MFADRDGTICVDKDYLSDPAQLELIPGAARGVAALNAAGLAVVLVSNQSGVARGYFTEDHVAAVNRRLRELLEEAGARVQGMYHCPHHPDHGEPPLRQACHCRKPAPGMLLRAADELNLDLPRSYVVGDKLSDIGAARNAGCAAGVLVLTGYGAKEQEKISDSSPNPDFIANDFLKASEWILQHTKAL